MDGPLSREKLQDDLKVFAKDTLRPLLEEWLRSALREELAKAPEERCLPVASSPSHGLLYTTITSQSNGEEDQCQSNTLRSFSGDEWVQKKSTNRSRKSASFSAQRLMHGTAWERAHSNHSVGEASERLRADHDDSYTALSTVDHDLEEEKTNYSLLHFAAAQIAQQREEAQRRWPNEHMDPRFSNDSGSNARRRETRVVRQCPQSIYELVNGPRFGIIAGIMVILNALFIGFDTDYRIQNDGKSLSIMAVSEKFFCVYFAIELGLRMYAYQCEFFTGDTKAWNIMDLLIVGMQVMEQTITLIHPDKKRISNFTLLRLLRVLRVIRVIRLVRVLHLFTELRQIVASMMNSFSVLIWSLSILIMVMYLFSVILLQFILDVGTHTKHAEELRYYFGSLGRAMYTLFESIVGGINWDDIVHPLDQDISPAVGLLFSVYIAASMFAIMNMLTGVFVDRAMQCVREDKDYCLANQIRDLFLGDDHTEEDEVDFDEFQTKMKSRVMRDYLEQINVKVSESEALFDLLDVDASGAVSSREIIDGCLRLRGPAKALDLALLMREVGILGAELRGLASIVATMVSPNFNARKSHTHLQFKD